MLPEENGGEHSTTIEFLPEDTKSTETKNTGLKRSVTSQEAHSLGEGLAIMQWCHKCKL